MNRYIAITREDEQDERLAYIEGVGLTLADARAQAEATLDEDFDVYEIAVDVGWETDVSPEDMLDDREADAVWKRIKGEDLWAWCYVAVTVEDPETGDLGRDTLGACSYEDEADFCRWGEQGDYFPDMVLEACRALRTSRETRIARKAWSRLKSYLPVTRYIGEDGALVVEIDTEYDVEGSPLHDNDFGPTPLRVYLNDGVLYANPDHNLDVQASAYRRAFAALDEAAVLFREANFGDEELAVRDLIDELNPDAGVLP